QSASTRDWTVTTSYTGSRCRTPSKAGRTSGIPTFRSLPRLRVSQIGKFARPEQSGLSTHDFGMRWSPIHASGIGYSPGVRVKGRLPQGVLSAEDLRVEFLARGDRRRVVTGVSFAIKAGETLGMVGESGSGKTVTALACMGLLGRREHAAVSGS